MSGGLGSRTTRVRDREGEAMSLQWLIERGQPEGLLNAEWLEHSAKHPATHKRWTRVARLAAMFPDKKSADDYIRAEGLVARAVEHGFMAAVPEENTEEKS